MRPVLIDAFRADGTIEGYSIVKLSADGGVVQAAAATDKFVGVAEKPGGAEGQHVSVHRLGITEVRLGGSVSAGSEITSDAKGFGIALTGAGESIGRAECGGVAGDIIPVFLRPLTIN